MKALEYIRDLVPIETPSHVAAIDYPDEHLKRLGFETERLECDKQVKAVGLRNRSCNIVPLYFRG